MGVMSTPEGTSDGGLGVPVDLRQRLQDTRVATAELMERLLASAQSGDTAFEARPGTEMLLFSTRGVQCVLPLTALREVLPELPSAVYLPFSPAWMLGIFPLRNELVGLVDPAPLLFGSGAGSGAPAAPDRLGSAPLAGLPGAKASTAALLVGSEQRCLAWMVDAVGEITHVDDVGTDAESDGASAASAIAPRYVAKVYRDEAEGRDIVVLRADALLDDLLSALEEGAGGEGGAGGGEGHDG